MDAKVDVDVGVNVNVVAKTRVVASSGYAQYLATHRSVH